MGARRQRVEVLLDHRVLAARARDREVGRRGPVVQWRQLVDLAGRKRSARRAPRRGRPAPRAGPSGAAARSRIAVLASPSPLRRGRSGSGRVQRRVERSVDVRTGEAVAIRYELAGLGSRFLAVIVDLLAQILLVVLLGIAFGFASPLLAKAPLGKNLEAWAIAAGIFRAVPNLLRLVHHLRDLVGRARRRVSARWPARPWRDGGFPIDAGAAVHSQPGPHRGALARLLHRSPPLAR